MGRRSLVRALFRKKEKNRTNSGRSYTADEIEAWLVAKLTAHIGVRPDEVKVQEPFARYGLDSRALLSLSGELEEWLGRELSPTLAWDHPTIKDLAAHLAEASASQPAFSAVAASAED